ncbi:hypothetical protein [Laceyella putida]|uniref:Uncharacterized protein n=1 Tax=Laceyella putida TaxID=110101 RepID=A0ABW2RJI7_9BACL
MSVWLATAIRRVNGKIIGPPPKDEQDPGYVDETYPGYLMYVPCGRQHDQGESWTEVYKQEVWYFDWVLKRKGMVNSKHLRMAR